MSTLAQQAAAPDLDPATAQGINQQIQDVTGKEQRLGDVIAARRADPANTRYGVATADSMSLVYPRDRPCNCSTRPASLGLARGEDQSEQVVLMPYAADLTGASVSVTSVSGSDGHADGVTAAADPVGYLNTTPTDAYHNTNDGTPWYKGWIPDPIRTDLGSAEVPAGSFQSYWITLHATDRARAGHYRVTLRISAGNVEPQNVTLPVEVWPFTIADRLDLTTAFEFEPTIISQLYGLTDPAQVTAKLRQYEDFLETYKIEPGNIYTTTPPTVDDLQ